jgi:23S rRNA pseudouridine1911/1915/1917 synthase
MSQVHEVLPAALAGERVDRIVSLITGVTRSEATELVAAGAVEVNGEVVRTKSRRLDEGDAVEVSWEPPEGPSLPQGEPDIDFVVVADDDDVIVVDKPAGLVVHPGAGNWSGTLVNGLLARYPDLAEVGDPARPGIVHRLDKDTSGLMMVARSARAYEALVAQLSARTVDRRYQALVWGHPEVSHGVVDAPIGRSVRDPTRMAVTERGRDAVTRYEVIDRFDEPVAVASVACKLETGRTHQIRVHLTALGHPVVGDDRYHGVRESLVVPRLFLHAGELGFEHPVSGDSVSYTSVLPDDLVGVLAGLGNR